MVSARRDERGAGSVLAVAMIGPAGDGHGRGGGVVGVVAAHRIAQSAADLAALAGAGALQDGGDACGQAADVARRNRARLSGCAVDGWNVSVVVSADTARSRAARSTCGPGVVRGPRSASCPGPVISAHGHDSSWSRRSRARRACTRRAWCSAR